MAIGGLAVIHSVLGTIVSMRFWKFCLVGSLVQRWYEEAGQYNISKGLYNGGFKCGLCIIQR